jgi:DNA-binding NarL/FixJ family response regulator
VLTTSKERRDVLDSFELGASGYMVKPVDYSKFVEILSRIVIYWSSSELPIQETLLAEIKH